MRPSMFEKRLDSNKLLQSNGTITLQSLLLNLVAILSLLAMDLVMYYPMFRNLLKALLLDRLQFHGLVDRRLPIWSLPWLLSVPE